MSKIILLHFYALLVCTASWFIGQPDSSQHPLQLGHPPFPVMRRRLRCSTTPQLDYLGQWRTMWHVHPRNVLVPLLAPAGALKDLVCTPNLKPVSPVVLPNLQQEAEPDTHSLLRRLEEQTLSVWDEKHSQSFLKTQHVAIFASHSGKPLCALPP